MTLSTDVYVLDEIDPGEVFRFCQSLLTKYDDRPHGPHPQTCEDSQDTSWDGEPGKFSAKSGNPWTMANKVGQGLPAWLMLHYRPGEPLRTPEQTAAHGEWCNLPGSEHYHEDEPDCDGHIGGEHQPTCWLSLDFDTTYGYRDARGMGCGDLHAALVAELGQWLTGRGVRWLWRNEFSGEIHEGCERLIDLCTDGFAAQAWFTTAVAPAIVADVASKGGGKLELGGRIYDVPPMAGAS